MVASTELMNNATATITKMRRRESGRAVAGGPPSPTEGSVVKAANLANDADVVPDDRDNEHDHSGDARSAQLETP